MSVINKTPYLEKVLAKLTDTNLATLKSVINGGTKPVFKSLVDADHLLTAADKGVKLVNLQLSLKEPYKTGFLLFNDDVCVLIAYHRFQDLQLIEIDTTIMTYKVIKEYCDIEELRRCLVDYSGGGGTVNSVNGASPDDNGNVEINGYNIMFDSDSSESLSFKIDSLETAVEGKQNELTAGDNITIIDNVISASGGSGGTKLYKHDVYNTGGQGNFEIVTLSPTPFTETNSFCAAINTAIEKGELLSAYPIGGQTTTGYIVLKITNSSPYIETATINSHSCTDRVTEL